MGAKIKSVSSESTFRCGSILSTLSSTGVISQQNIHLSSFLSAFKVTTVWLFHYHRTVLTYQVSSSFLTLECKLVDVYQLYLTVFD